RRAHCRKISSVSRKRCSITRKRSSVCWKRCSVLICASTNKVTTSSSLVCFSAGTPISLSTRSMRARFFGHVFANRAEKPAVFSLYADDRAGRLPDHGIGVRPQAAESAGGRPSPDHQQVGADAVRRRAHDLRGVSCFEEQLGFHAGALFETRDLFPNGSLQFP